MTNDNRLRVFAARLRRLHEGKGQDDELLKEVAAHLDQLSDDPSAVVPSPPLSLRDKLRIAHSPVHHEHHEQMKRSFKDHPMILNSLKGQIDRIDRRILMNHLADLSEKGHPDPDHHREVHASSAEGLFELTEALHLATRNGDALTERNSVLAKRDLQLSSELSAMTAERNRLMKYIEDARRVIEQTTPGMMDQVDARIAKDREDDLQRRMAESRAAAEAAREATGHAKMV